MNCIIIVDKLPSQVSRKGGLYPTAIRTHHDIGLTCGLLQLYGSSDATFVETARELSVTGITLISRSSTWWEVIQDTWREPLLLPVAWKFRHHITSGIAWFAALEQNAIQSTVISAITSTKESGVVAYLLAKRLNLPFVIWEHRTNYQRKRFTWFWKQRVKIALKNAAAVCTVSPQLLNAIRSFTQLPIPQGRVVPNPIPYGFLKLPGPDDKEWITKFSQGRFLYGGWTNWRPIKRPDLLIHAFAQVHAQNNETCLIVAGSVPSSIPKLVTRFGLDDAVLLPGSLDREQIQVLSYRIDCCVIPSDHETFGLPAIEAMSAGVPVVATRCGGPESIITAPELGITVPTGDQNALADAMLHVFTHRGSYDKDFIIKTVTERYGQEAFKNYWREVYSLVRNDA